MRRMTVGPALQSGLQRFAKPWYRLRAMRVFRDKTGYRDTGVVGSIQKALADADYFILLASPRPPNRNGSNRKSIVASNRSAVAC